MVDSILTSIKLSLGVAEANTAFDQQLIMFINSVLPDLGQLGVGPEEGFIIEDANTEWSEFLEDDMKRNNVMSYLYVRVKQLFDPPSNAALQNSYKEMEKQAAWRINVRTTEVNAP